jgi:hypothetical protein
MVALRAGGSIRRDHHRTAVSVAGLASNPPHPTVVSSEMSSNSVMGACPVTRQA